MSEYGDSPATMRIRLQDNPSDDTDPSGNTPGGSGRLGRRCRGRETPDLGGDQPRRFEHRDVPHIRQCHRRDRGHRVDDRPAVPRGREHSIAIAEHDAGRNIDPAQRRHRRASIGIVDDRTETAAVGRGLEREGQRIGRRPLRTIDQRPQQRAPGRRRNRPGTQQANGRSHPRVEAELAFDPGRLGPVGCPQPGRGDRGDRTRTTGRGQFQRQPPAEGIAGDMRPVQPRSVIARARYPAKPVTVYGSAVTGPPQCPGRVGAKTSKCRANSSATPAHACHVAPSPWMSSSGSPEPDR